MRVLPLLAALALAGPAAAQSTHKCAGETWAEIASARYGDAALGRLIALYDGAVVTTRCEAGRFVRLPATIRHTLREGQTLAQLLPRFLRARGAEAFVRARNTLEPGAVVVLPAELELRFEGDPDAELAAIPGVPSLELVRAYNAVDLLPRGKPIYVPLLLEPRAAPPPAPVPVPSIAPAPVVEATPTATTAPTALSPDAPPSPALSRAVETDVVAESARFQHAPHRRTLDEQWRCELCHARDGALEYAPVCERCHARIARGPRVFQLALGFSHALHVDPAGKAARRGYDADCELCHALQDDGTRARPGHPICAKCHNRKEVSPFIDEQCEGCHGPGEDFDRLAAARALLARHLEGSVRGDGLRFSHAEHREAECARCHVGADRATSRDGLEPQTMGECLSCHRGLLRGAEALDECASCHLARRAAIAPRFEGLLTKPLGHSEGFRRGHAEVARDDAGACQGCHGALAGDAGARCERCHLRERPRDHGARWREEPHGRAAERDPERCAVCHAKDRCVDCHALAPRDHYPRRVFVSQHRAAAERSPARCVTCHLPAIDCARCHPTEGP